MRKYMKILTFNVNGLRACIKKDFIESMKKLNPDIICLQETKIQENQLPHEIDELNMHKYWHFAKKKGYSGTAVFTKIEPLILVSTNIS